TLSGSEGKTVSKRVGRVRVFKRQSLCFSPVLGKTRERSDRSGSSGNSRILLFLITRAAILGKAVLIKGEVPPSNQYGPRPRPLHLIETGKTADTGKDLQYAHNTITHTHKHTHRHTDTHRRTHTHTQTLRWHPHEDR